MYWHTVYSFEADVVSTQVYIKTKAFDDALEFLSRTLYLDPFHIKVKQLKCLFVSPIKLKLTLFF